MNALAAQQRALLRSLWLPGIETAALLAGPQLARADGKSVRGLRAYRANGRALASRALAAAYPTVLHVLGEENFDGLARTHWLRRPPAQGDIARWGARLAQHIESIPQLVADEPQLAHLARVDWALHCAATAANDAQQLPTLQLLVNLPPDRVTLRLAPATALVGDTLVWRQGFRPVSRPLAQGEAELVAALLARQPLASALDAAPGIDFASWLASAVEQQLVLRACRIRTLEKPS
ncbi:HvfC/BufC family peptide modification chaperone [Ramlibacter albus]|uniref:DNA-binding domain-containing protein n=1 Tax=Ramlibacter albus TaxID=2079448 RepID=A0A923S8E3_9BURK|nr:putative DNA-binding domain-containing protein [Ramlibacter albus]MBC5768007.1 putative DNA-binding domain-containing protein [Ramlibacter albus]